MTTRRFWVRSAERAVKTAAQAALLVLGGDATGVLTADLRAAVLAAIGGAVLSLLTSVSSAPLGPPDDPSLVG